MTWDEMERAMEFVVKQEAQFAADMQQVREVLHTHSEALVGVLGMIGKLTEAQLRTESRMEGLETKMTELARAQKELTEAQKGLTEAQKGLTEAQEELAEAQKGTEERLNAFITFVEKYISGRNGGGRGSAPHTA